MLRRPFDPRQTLSVVVHDLGPVRVSRPGADGTYVTAEERRLAMSAFVDDKEVIGAGLMLDGGDRLVAFSACGVCDLWECNLSERHAAKVRRFGPYVVWITAWGDTYTFAYDRYAEVLGPGAERLPELTCEDAWDLDDPEPGGRYAGLDGRLLVVDLERDPDGPLSVLREWPDRGREGLCPVEPPVEALEIRAADKGGQSIWIDAAPRACGSRAAYLPGVMRVRAWCSGPAIDRVIEQLVGPSGARGREDGSSAR